MWGRCVRLGWWSGGRGDERRLCEGRVCEGRVVEGGSVREGWWRAAV